jgi:hypothetical protein
VIAAVEQFLRDTTPPTAPTEAPPNAWTRAARLEGIDREPTRNPW